MDTTLLVILALFIGSKIPDSFYAFVRWYQNRKIWKDITPTDVDQKKLCRVHNWIDGRTLTENGETITKVCRVCGLIQGTNKMATPAGLDMIEENNRFRQVEEDLYQEFVKNEEVDLKKYLAKDLANGLNFDKVATIHNAGITFAHRFTLYKAAKSKEITALLNKSDA